MEPNMNRDHVTINWKFTRKKARQKFGYKMNKFNLSEAWWIRKDRSQLGASRECRGVQDAQFARLAEQAANSGTLNVIILLSDGNSTEESRT
jgi:hypothetical protein